MKPKSINDNESTLGTSSPDRAKSTHNILLSLIDSDVNKMDISEKIEFIIKSGYIQQRTRAVNPQVKKAFIGTKSSEKTRSLLKEHLLGVKTLEDELIIWLIEKTGKSKTQIRKKWWDLNCANQSKSLRRTIRVK